MNLGTIRKVRSLIILGLDLAAAISIFSGISYLRLQRLPDYLSYDLWLIVLTFILTLYLSGTYFKEKSNALPGFPVQTFFICLIGGALCVLWVYLLGPSEFNNYFGRGVLPIGTILFGVATTIIRYAINSLYHIQEKGLEILYLGYSQSCDVFLKELQTNSEVRSVTVLSKQRPKITNSFMKVTHGDINEEVLQRDWQAIIVDPAHHSSQTEKTLLISTKLSGTPVVSLADYYESNWYMVPVNHIEDDWFLRSQGFSMVGSPISGRIKRLLDIFLSLLLFTLSIPIVLICGLLIKLTSRGPVFFTQTRVGYKGKGFKIYKLRTMDQDAEAGGAQWAATDDPRITLFGSFLRKTRLDELPQCWNVLKGDMSFVGPRPERPEFTKMLARAIPYYELRHMVKPGISGWAQVIFPYGASTEDSLRKLQYELYYIKHQSLFLDMNIMIRTLFTVFQRAGR